MIWIPVGVWAGAALLALVLLGYCAYELTWKAKRLRTDLARLQGLFADAQQLRIRLEATKQRIAATGLR